MFVHTCAACGLHTNNEDGPLVHYPALEAWYHDQCAEEIGVPEGDMEQ